MPRLSKADQLERAIGRSVDESIGARRVADAARGDSPRITPPAPDPRWEGVSRDPDACFIPCDRIVPDPDQPRKEFDPEDLGRLACSLEDRHQLQPIVVRWRQDLDPPRWMIVDGERRWRATVAAGLDRIAAVIDDQADPGEVLVDQLVANCCRAELAPLERAEAFRRVIGSRGWSGRELARNLGISQASVSKALALLELPEEVRGRVERGELSAATAYELRALADPAEQVAVAVQVAGSNLSRDEVRGVIRRESPKPPPGPVRWRGVPILGVALRRDLAEALIGSEIDTAGRAWDLIEAGLLVEAGFSAADARLIEGAIVGLREEAGDPAPCTVAMPEVDPWKFKLLEHSASGLPPMAVEAAEAIGVFTFGDLADRFAAGTDDATFRGWSGILWSTLNRIKGAPPSVYRPRESPRPAGEGRDVPRRLETRPDDDAGRAADAAGRRDFANRKGVAAGASPVDPLPPWRQVAFGVGRELPLAAIAGVEVLARANVDEPPWKVLLALKDAVARVELEITRGAP